MGARMEKKSPNPYDTCWTLQPVCREADLHRRQHDRHETDRGRYPHQVVAEEAAVAVPGAGVWAEGGQAAKGVETLFNPVPPGIGSAATGILRVVICFCFAPRPLMTL